MIPSRKQLTLLPCCMCLQVNTFKEYSAEHIQLHMLFYANYQDYADLFDFYMGMYFVVNSFTPQQRPSLLGNGKYKWHNWDGMKAALQAWKAWGVNQNAVVALGGAPRRLTAAERDMCAGPSLAYYTEKCVSIGGVQHTAMPGLESRLPAKVRDAVIMTDTPSAEIPFYGIIRKGLLMRTPGALLAASGTGDGSAKAQHTEVVLQNDWLQRPAQGNIHPVLRTPLFKAVNNQLVLMPVSTVNTTFSSGKFISAQQVYPTNSIITPISQIMATVLHRDPQVTALTDLAQRVRLC
jgi:hypothetical protein